MKHKSVRSGISLLAVVILVCLSGLRTVARETDPFTFPELDGWEVKQEYPVYFPGTLWDYINGAADSYLSYHFRELYIAEYLKGDISFKVEIYRHDTPLDAFGIYSQERSPDYHFIDLGIQGYREGSLIHFLADKYYVKVRTHSASGEVESAMMSIASSVTENIGGVDHFPETLAMFPGKGKKPETEIYTAENFLGHSFLGSAFTAEYSRDGKSFKMFIIVRENKTDCLKLLEHYFKFAEKKENPPGEGEIIIADKYNGKIVAFWHKNMIFGTVNLEDSKIQRQVISEIKESLK